MSKSSSVTNVEYKAEGKPEVDVESASSGNDEDEGDGVFGGGEGDDINYTSVGFLGSFILMAKTQIGLVRIILPSPLIKVLIFILIGCPDHSFRLLDTWGSPWE
jgi:hypothetical protein